MDTTLSRKYQGLLDLHQLRIVRRPAKALRRVRSARRRWSFQPCRFRPSRNALATTDTELKLIAKAAIMGLSSRPVRG